MYIYILIYTYIYIYIYTYIWFPSIFKCFQFFFKSWSWRQVHKWQLQGWGKKRATQQISIQERKGWACLCIMYIITQNSFP